MRDHSPMEWEARGVDPPPFAAGRERLDLAQDRGTVDRWITQPITVALGDDEVPGTRPPAFVHNPVGHDAASREEGDHLSPAPRRFGIAADANAGTVRNRRPHAGAA